MQGKSVKLEVQQDSHQILFSMVPPQRRPRHAFIPRWHFDMVHDQLRNEAYDQAITRVCASVPTWHSDMDQLHTGAQGRCHIEMASADQFVEVVRSVRKAARPPQQGVVLAGGGVQKGSGVQAGGCPGHWSWVGSAVYDGC